VQQQTIDVDGSSATFEYLASGDSWVARREHDGTMLVLLASGIDPATIALHRLTALDEE
jgi:hypothetical protein